MCVTEWTLIASLLNGNRAALGLQVRGGPPGREAQSQTVLRALGLRWQRGAPRGSGRGNLKTGEAHGTSALHARYLFPLSTFHTFDIRSVVVFILFTEPLRADVVRIAGEEGEGQTTTAETRASVL